MTVWYNLMIIHQQTAINFKNTGHLTSHMCRGVFCFLSQMNSDLKMWKGVINDHLCHSKTDLDIVNLLGDECSKFGANQIKSDVLEELYCISVCGHMMDHFIICPVPRTAHLLFRKLVWSKNKFCLLSSLPISGNLFSYQFHNQSKMTLSRWVVLRLHSVHS